MKRLFFIALALMLLPTAVLAADDVVSRGMKLYEKRHYNEAISMLSAEMHSLDESRRPDAGLILGMSFLKNAGLHMEMHRMSLAVHEYYLGKLSSQRGEARSRMADMYLAEAMIADNKPDAAIVHLERFLAEPSVPDSEKVFGTIYLGLAHVLKGDMPVAEGLWAGVSDSSPEVKAALAAAYIKAGISGKNPVSMADEAEAEARGGKRRSMRLLKDCLSVYAKAGEVEKGLALLKMADLAAYSYKETRGRSKVINFYSPSLLRDMSDLYLRAAISSLEKASAAARLKDTANFYLGEAYAMAGMLDQSSKATVAFISSQMPQQLKDIAKVRQAANLYKKGRQFDALSMWDELTQRPDNPEVLAEVLFSCSSVKAECPKAVKAAVAAVETADGRKYAILNIAVGSYYLARRDYAKALSYLEAGRDKGNKNRIEYNDPVMLVRLAEAYYRTKKFSEALEIYFEMSRQFPEVRQIQETLQGVYSMEHKSAGDVKIF